MHRLIALALVVLLALALLALWFYLQPNDVNWSASFGPAASAFLIGRDPYAASTFFNPPWALGLLAPLSVLPLWITRTLLTALTFLSYILAARKMGARTNSILLLLLSASVALSLYEVNLDGLVFLGLLMPAPLGLFFFLLKPQVGAGLALFYLIEAWRTRRGKGLVLTLAPVLFAFGLSVWQFGFWFGPALSLHPFSINLSLFPFSVPAGLYLAVQSLRRRDLRYAVPVGMCLSPYLGLASWAAPLLALSGNWKRLVAASALSYPVMFLAYLFHAPLSSPP